MKTRARAALTCAVLLHVMASVSTTFANESSERGGNYSTADVQVDVDAAKEEAKYES